MNDELMRLALAQGLISKSLHTAERENHAHSGCRNRKRISAPQLRGVSRETLLSEKYFAAKAEMIALGES